MRFPILLAAGLFALSTAAMAESSYTLTIKDHRFDPAELTVPAGEKIQLKVVNQDRTPEEFESKDLHREKVIPGGGQITLTIGPLKPGKYEYFGEFNPTTARGFIVAQPK